MLKHVKACALRSRARVREVCAGFLQKLSFCWYFSPSMLLL